MFIKQSFRSNYCGVYSTGMLLSLLGIPITRADVLTLFELETCNPDYRGATHVEMGTVFATVTKVRSWRWECHKRFDFALVSKSLRAQLQSNDCPTLLSFGAIHKNGKWRCTHGVVAINATHEFIEILDPLGTRPQGNKGNVWFRIGDGPKSVHVLGTSYSINPASETAVFRWTPAIHD